MSSAQGLKFCKETVKFCKVHHFAGDTNLLCLSNYQKLNKLLNADLKHLANWLNENKTSLNTNPP